MRGNNDSLPAAVLTVLEDTFRESPGAYLTATDILGRLPVGHELFAAYVEKTGAGTAQSDAQRAITRVLLTELNAMLNFNFVPMGPSIEVATRRVDEVKIAVRLARRPTDSALESSDERRAGAVLEADLAT